MDKLQFHKLNLLKMLNNWCSNVFQNFPYAPEIYILHHFQEICFLCAMVIGFVISIVSKVRFRSASSQNILLLLVRWQNSKLLLSVCLQFFSFDQNAISNIFFISVSYMLYRLISVIISSHPLFRLRAVTKKQLHSKILKV